MNLKIYISLQRKEKLNPAQFINWAEWLIVQVKSAVRITQNQPFFKPYFSNADIMRE